VCRRLMMRLVMNLCRVMGMMRMRMWV
jgi:hypothetical protein